MLLAGLVACTDPDQEVRLAAFLGAQVGGEVGDVYQEDHAPVAGDAEAVRVVDDCVRSNCPDRGAGWSGALDVAVTFEGDDAGVCAACGEASCTSSAWTATIHGDITVRHGLNVSEDCGPVDGNPPGDVPPYDAHVELSGRDGTRPIGAETGSECAPSMVPVVRYEGTVQLAGRDPPGRRRRAVSA